MCVSNPELLADVIKQTKSYWKKHPDLDFIGIGPNDGYGYCECAKCRALDSGRIDPWNGQRCYTDRYIYFINKVIEEVSKEYPGKRYYFYIYQSHFLPPTIIPNPAICGTIAPINLDRIHGIDNPHSLDRYAYKEIMEQWCRHLPMMVERGYYFNLADLPLPYSKIHALRSLIPLTRKLGFIGHTPETKVSWASNGPTVYVAAKLFWNADLDPYAVLKDYAMRFFGPAGESMYAYLKKVDELWRDAPTMSGGSYSVCRVFKTSDVAVLSKLLATAEQKTENCKNEVYHKRVAMFAVNFEILTSFLKMWQARNNCDFEIAKAAYDKAESIISRNSKVFLAPCDKRELPANERRGRACKMAMGVLINPTGPDRYLRRFFEKIIQSGYDRTVSQGQKIVQLPDEWDFLIDPTDAGEFGKWYRDGKFFGNWQRMKTYSETWSDQGLHFYKGLAWYRTEFSIPQVWKNKKIMLWFGGVDEKAKVWVNGKYVGSTEEPGEGIPGVPGAFCPVDFDITSVVRFGKPNFIAVRVENFKSNEIGTGGITAPVMLWSPRKKDKGK